MGRVTTRARRCGAIALASLLLAGLVTMPIEAASGTSQSARPGTELTNTTFGGYSQLDQIDMLSPTLGYALATRYMTNGRYQYYLVRTTNQARTWFVRSAVPSDLTRYPIFTDFDTYDSDPTIDFVSQEVGYVDGPGRTIYLTTDGGLAWKRLVGNATTSSYGVSGTTLSVVTSSCVGGSDSTKLPCTSVLREFAVGSVIPEASHLIPVGREIDGWNVGLLAVAPGGIDVVNDASNSMSTASSLLITRDGGATWSELDNPCHGSLIEQMIVARDGQWVLSCFLDGGSYHGTAQIFRSTNDGVTWTTVLDDTAQRNLVGNLGGTPTYLFFNGDDRILYGAMMNPAGGLEVSYNGGTTWSRENVLGDTGGSPGSITNLSATSTMYQVFQGPVFLTNNARNWRILPLLPAGTYHGLSICTKASTSVSLRHARSDRLRYTYIDFTNNGNRSCYLDGGPTIEGLDKKGHPVGPMGTTASYSNGGDFVILRADGGVASTSLWIDTTSTIHPASTCAAAQAHALRVRFGAPSSFVLSLRGHPLSICTRMPSIMLIFVRKGPGRP